MRDGTDETEKVPLQRRLELLSWLQKRQRHFQRPSSSLESAFLSITPENGSYRVTVKRWNSETEKVVTVFKDMHKY